MVSKNGSLEYQLDSMGDSPSHDCRYEAETTADFEELCRISQTLGSWIISNLVIRRCNEAKEDDEREEDDDEGHIGAKRAQEENEADQGHDDGIVSLARIPGLANGTFCTISAHERMRWIASVCLIDPMAPINDEDDERERVSKDKLGNAGNIHGDAAHKVPRTADSDQRS